MGEKMNRRKKYKFQHVLQGFQKIFWKVRKLTVQFVYCKGANHENIPKTLHIFIIL